MTVSQPLNPAPDGGWGWMITACSLFILCLSHGQMLSMSVVYISWLEEFGQSRGNTAWVLSIAFASIYGLGTVAAFLANRIGFRATVVIGGLLAGLGLILSCWATSVTYLIFSVGIVSGIGCSLCYLSSFAVVSAYFTSRLSIATGVACSGVGIGAFASAPIVDYMTATYGWRSTLLIMGAVSFHICIFGLLLRPLVPAERSRLLEVVECDRDEKEELNYANYSEIGESDMEQQDAVQIYSLNEEGNIKTGTASQSDCVEIGPGLTVFNKLLDTAHRSNRHNTQSKGSVDACLNAFSRDKQSSLFPFSSHKELPTTISAETIPSQKWTLKKDLSLDILFANSLNQLSGVVLGASVKNLVGGKVEKMRGNSFNKNVKEEDETDLESKSSEIETKNVSVGKSSKSGCVRIFSGVVEENVVILKDPTFMLYAVSNFITNLSYITPIMYMVDRAIDSGIDKTTAALLISISGVGSIFGRLFFGIVTYRLFPDRLMTYIVVLALAGIATSLSALCGDSVFLHSAYAAVIGILLGGYATLSAVVTIDLMGAEKGSQSFGLLLSFMGVASLMGPPLGGFLFDLTQTYQLSYVIQGIFLLISVLILLPLALARRRRRRMDKREKENSKG